jgi:hypothetical protein
MLNEMGQAVIAFIFIPCTCIDKHCKMRYRSGSGQVYEPKAV